MAARNEMRTTFLFVIPTFFSGFARLIDMGGVYDLYTQSRNGDEADARALYSDFRMVGQDLQQSMNLFHAAHQDLQRKHVTVRHVTEE